MTDRRVEGEVSACQLLPPPISSRIHHHHQLGQREQWPVDGRAAERGKREAQPEDGVVVEEEEWEERDDRENL